MASVYEIVTNKILEALEKGVIPWVNPYTGKFHQNFISKHEYSGVNALLLNAIAFERGYTTPYWATYRQAKEKGWNVKKGAKSAMVTFWKEYVGESTSDNNIEETIIDENGVEKKTVNKNERKFVLRYYTIFNLDEVEGCEMPKDDTKDDDFTVIANTVSIPSDYCKNQGIEVQKTLNGASFYAPLNDSIGLAPVKPEFFVPVFAHECVHSTGNKKRLDRFDSDIFVEKIEYSFEELIAEIGSAMLCSQMNIEFSIENSASYVSGWAEFLKEDKKTAIVRASAKAQKAVEFILKAAQQEQKQKEVII
jgi:antirestriction protein ArdC